MIEKNINNEFDSLFKEGLENNAITPPNGVWENLSSQMGSQASNVTIAKTIATKTTSLWIKTSLFIAVASISGVIAYQAFNSKTEQQTLNSEIANNANTTNNSGQTIIQSEEIESELNESEKSDNKNIGVTPPILNEKSKSKPQNATHNTKETIVIENKTTAKESKDISDNIDNTSKNTNSKLPETQPNETIQNDEIYKDESEPITLNPIKKDTIFIIIPNVVTPNNDGINDVYRIEMKGEIKFYMAIFNDKMERIFETSNKNNAWDCKLSNLEDAPAGNYIVIVKYQLKNSDEKTETTKLKLIR
ncbi:MAG: gliding motility-associated C-terminal domain-containing protein [Bacteroidota bacterium]|nr:gliding motility-associated C-terminal domain-containing protein [Bacteroidota bacterium]